jgi:AraC-like DNA-binding protein
MLADCGNLVRAAWSVEGPAKDAVLPGFVAPDCHVEFVFHLDACWSVRQRGTNAWSPQPRAFIYAGDRGCLEFSGTGHVSTVAVRVSPVTATRLLGRTIGDIWNQTLALQDFVGSEADELIESLRRSAPAARYQIIGQWIRARLHAWHAADAEAERLFWTLLWTSHGGTIAEVARALGPSERSLRRTLARHAGLAPKDVQLTGRLLSACALLREDAQLNITDVAARTGFFDHAALTHACHSRLGLTPQQLRAETHVFYERAPVRFLQAIGCGTR